MGKYGGIQALDVYPPRSDNADTSAKHAKTEDPYIFKPAEWFFKQVAGEQPKTPTSVTCDDADQLDAGGKLLPVASHGRIFRFNNPRGYFLIQFMRPKVWRIRFCHTNKEPSHFTDYNTKTIVQNTLTKTIDVLDQAEGLSWHVELIRPNDQYYVLQSVLDSDSANNKSRQVVVQLWIQKSPISITAVRVIKATSALMPVPSFSLASDIAPDVVEKLKIPTSEDTRLAVIWQTKPNPLQWLGDATVFAIEKPLTAKYTGFGEQGGRRMFKDNVCMNYFSES